MRRLAVGLLVLASALVVVPAALGSRPPTADERVGIVAGWSGSPTRLADTRCLIVRVSTVGRRWAALRASPAAGCRATAFDGSSFLHRTADRWDVVVGGSSVRPKDCRLVPRAVRDDLPVFTRALGC